MALALRGGSAPLLCLHVRTPDEEITMTHPPSFDPPTLISKEEGFAQMGMAGTPRTLAGNLLARIDEEMARVNQSFSALETALAPALEPPAPQQGVAHEEGPATSELNARLLAFIEGLGALSERIHDVHHRVAL